MKKIIYRFINYLLLIFNCIASSAQLKWTNVDSLYQPLPASLHVFKSNDSLEGKPNIAYYVIADLNDKKNIFEVDTTLRRRLKPSQFYDKNDHPLVVVNGTFFSFKTNQNLTVVIKDRKLVAYNVQSLTGTAGKDSSTDDFPFRSAIGIRKNRTADIAWLFSNSLRRWPIAYEVPVRQTNTGLLKNFKAEMAVPVNQEITKLRSGDIVKKWKMQTAVGGGPVLLQDGRMNITNEEEMMFRGKRINEREPRTAMGYTKDNKLIILVVQGRFPGIAEGASLVQEAQMLKELGCREALNLDGGGSSCMLVNGKETIKPSDAAGQRPVPAVFIIKEKGKR